jgi:hypothetical protein
MKKETLKELAAITPSLRTKKPTYLQEIAKKSDPPSKQRRRRGITFKGGLKINIHIVFSQSELLHAESGQQQKPIAKKRPSYPTKQPRELFIFRPKSFPSSLEKTAP